MARLVNDAEEALKYVEEQIEAHKVVVFSKSYCPYCVKVNKRAKRFSL
jgi:L-lactate utilization protein LutB